MKAKLLFSAIALMAASSSYAGELIYSYAQSDDLYNWGLRAAQSYNIAIFLDSSFAGSQIQEFTVPVTVTDNTTDFTMWLTSELNVDKVGTKKVPHIDVMCDTVVPTDVNNRVGRITCKLDEPYTIPETGIYVGYSFTVDWVSDDSDRYPVLVTIPAQEGGLFVFTSKTYLKWKDRSTELGAVSPIAVTLSGDFTENSVNVSPIGDIYIQANQTSTYPIEIINLGTGQLESLGYEFTVGDKTYPGTYTYDVPQPGIFNRKYTAEVELPDLPVGKHDYTLKVTTVNGAANATEAVTTGTFDALELLPINRPLMEEFTGTWCQWCTRGWIALEKMSEFHPDFVAIAYHDNDPMSMESYPEMVSGFPTAVLDRSTSCDPYYGPGSKPFGIEDVWYALKKQFSPAEILLDVEVSDDNRYVKVTSDVYWAVEPEEGEYKVEYVLVGDGFQQPTWYQQNGYASTDPSQGGIYLDIFCKGGEYGFSRVFGLEYNDVALLSSGGYGVEGSVESTAVGSHNTYTYTFDMTESAIAPKAKSYSVVAMILRNDGPFGRVVNCNKAPVTLVDGITQIAADKKVVNEQYYDLSGRQIAHPANGIYIKKVTYADGTSEACRFARSKR